MAYQLGSPVRLETQRILLRSMTQQDVTPAFVSWLTDPDVNRHLFQPPPELVRRGPEALARGFVATADNRTRFMLGMWVKANSELIGYLRLAVEPLHRRVVPTMVIGNKDWWLRGVPRELDVVLMPFLFGELGLNKVISYVYAENTVVARLLERAGYVKEGHFREHEWNGERFRDVLQFSRLKSEWPPRRGSR